MEELKVLSPKDFVTDQEVRWCPGCGDYSILKQVQTVMPELGIPREQIVFISGISSTLSAGVRIIGGRLILCF